MKSELVTFRKELTSMSVPDLRAELSKGLTMTARGLSHMAAVWEELESRGEDLSDLRCGMGLLLPVIASGRLAAEAVVAFAGRPLILKHLEGMPLDQQRRYADGEPIPVYLEGSREPEALPLVRIPPHVVAKIIKNGRVLTPAEQRLAAKPRKTPPARKYQPSVDKVNRTIRIGNTVAPIATVTGALADAAGVKGLVIDSVERPAKHIAVKLTDEEYATAAAAAKAQGIELSELARQAVITYCVLSR